MPELGKGVESEIPSVSDTVPKAVTDYQKKKKRKISAKELIDNVPAPDHDFRPLSVPERLTHSLVTNKKTPIEYFSIFFTSDWLQRFAEFTNKNAVEKRQYGTKSRKSTSSPTPRAWTHPTSGPEVGVFIGSLLMMGLERKGRVPLYWAEFFDVQGNYEIMTVIHPMPFFDSNWGLWFVNLSPVPLSTLPSRRAADCFRQ